MMPYDMTLGHSIPKDYCDINHDKNPHTTIGYRRFINQINHSKKVFGIEEGVF